MNLLGLAEAFYESEKVGSNVNEQKQRFSRRTKNLIGLVKAVFILETEV